MSEPIQPNEPASEATPFLDPNDPQAAAPQPPAAQGPATPPPPAPPTKSRRGRRWLIGIATAVVLLILLVLLLPTIASTGPVRSMVVRQVNDRLNGRVEIESYSVGWTGGVRASGVKLFDAEGRQILQLGRLDTGLSLWEILRGNYDAGKVTIEDLDFLARREADGRLNFAKLMKEQPGEPKTKSEKSSSSSKLPDVSAEIVLKNARGTYEDVVEKKTVQFTSIDGRVNIPNINAPIETALTVVANTPQHPSGTLKLNGTADVIENNQVLADFGKASVNETINIGDFANGGFAPIVLAAGGPIDKLDGVTNGSLTVVLTPGAGGAVEGQIVSSNFALGGPALHGDTFATRQLSLTIPKTTVSLSAGQTDWQDWRVVVGGDATQGKPNAITLAFQQNAQPGTLALAGQFTPRAVLNALDKKAPGGEGQFALTTNLDLGDLAAKLPRTFAALGEGVQLGQGQLALNTTAGYKGETLSLESHVALQNADVSRAVPAAVVAAATQPVPGVVAVLDDGSLKTDLVLNGSFQNGGLRASVAQLNVNLADKQSGDKPILSLSKGQGELAFALPAQSAAPPTGRIDLAADLARLSQISRGFSNDPNRLTTAPGQTAQLRRGDLAGTIGFGRSQDNLVQLSSQLNLTNIDVDVPTGGKPIRGEQFAVTLSAKASDDFSLVRVDDTTITGRLLNGKVTDTELRLASGGGGMPADAWSLVQRASVELNFPELGQLQDFIDSLRPPAMKPKAPGAGYAVSPQPVLLASAAPVRGAVELAQADPRGSDVIGSRRPPAGGGASGSDRISSPPPQPRQQQPQPSGGDRISSPPPPRDRTSQPDRNRAAPPQSAPPRQAVPEPAPAGARAPAQAAATPKQGDPGPTRLRDGSATIRVKVARQNEWLIVTPTVTARDVAYQTGDVYHPLGAVDVNLEARLVPNAGPAPAGASALAQVRQVTIPVLKASLANSTVELTKPLVIDDLAMFLKSLDATTAPGRAPTTRPAAPGGQLVSIATALAATLDLGRLSAALEGLQGARSGDGPDDPPYAGVAKIQQEVATGPEGIYLKGTGTIDNLRTGTRRDPGLSEQRLTLADDLALDTRASVLHLANLSVDAQSSKAVQLAAKGTVREFSTTRKLENVTVDLAYDAAKLWDLLRPMLESPPEPGAPKGDSSLKDVKLAGIDKTHLELGGSYPAGLPFAEAARSLVANGSLGLKQFDGYGIGVQNLTLGLDLRDGVLKFSHPSGLPDVNSGKANFGGMWVTLGTPRDPHMRLYAPPNHVLAEKVSLNPVLSDTVIGKFVNPIFKDAAQAKGLIKVQLVEVKGLGLDYIRNSPIPAESGRAELLLSIDDLYLGVPNLASAINTAFPNALNENGFAAAIKDARVVIQGGQVWNDMTLVAEGKYAVGFGGGIGIRDLKMLNFGVTLPPSLIARVNKDLAKVVPQQGFKVALHGTTENWTQSLGQNVAVIAQDLVQQAINQNLRPENILGRVLGGGNNRPADPNAARPAGERDTAQPPPPANNPEDLLGDLLNNALGGGKKETDAEKRERRQRQREEKEKQQQQQPGSGGR